jgi:RNA polymerase primary sigma factor
MIASNLTQSTEAPAAAPEREEQPDRDSLQTYLREIGKTPLLTLPEELKLAARIRRGDQAARQHMIQANLRLVVKIAMDYRDFGLPLLDLISEGNIGLTKAVDRYDPAKGGKLSTYAAWWIKQSMQRALANQTKTIRLPVHVVSTISKLRKTGRALAEKLGREATDEELAFELNLPIRKVTHLRSVSVHPASLDAPLGDEADSSSLGEVVRDENAVSPVERLQEKNLSSDLTDVVDSLDEREAEIIRLRFGLAGKSELTLAEVGKKFNVTRERIRQLEQIALKQIRRRLEERESLRTAEDLAEDERAEQRAEVFREFAAKRAPAKSDRRAAANRPVGARHNPPSFVAAQSAA